MSTRDQVAELLGQGLSFSQVAETLGVTTPTVSYHAKKLGLSKGPRESYAWDTVQCFYDNHTRLECLRRFGMHPDTWAKAVARGDITLRSKSETPLKRGRVVGGHTLKACLLEKGVPYLCSGCSLAEWRGQPLSLQVDHIDGDRENNEIDNLRFLCPNCHSQTETFAGRNHKHLRG